MNTSRVTVVIWRSDTNLDRVEAMISTISNTNLQALIIQHCELGTGRVIHEIWRNQIR